MYEWFIANGVIGIFIISFVAATILPFSSEVVLAAAIKAGIPPWEGVLWASMGNCLACIVNYSLGAYFSEKMCSKMEGAKAGKAALRWMKKYGVYSLFLSWVPFIGDPLTVVAGIVKLPLYWFIPIVFTLRVLRYIIIAGIV